MRTRIAALSPKDAVAVPSLAATPACLSTWAGGLLFGGDGVTGLRFRCARGCLPRLRNHLGRHDSFGFDQGLLLSRRAPRVVRWSREAAALPCWMLHAARQRAAHPSRFAPAAFRPRGVSVPAGCISPCDPRYLRIAGRVAPGLRLPQATTAAPMPDFRQLSGLPVCRSGLRPYRHTAAPKRRQCTAGTKAAPEQNV